MSSSSLGNVRRLPSEEDLELQRYDVELGLEELKRQLRAIESDKSKELYERRKEAFNLRKAIREVEKGKDMPYDEFMKILRENSVPIKGTIFKKEYDPESGKEITVEVMFDNSIPLPSPRTGLRRRTPELRTQSPFEPIKFEDTLPSRPSTPLLPVTATDDTVVKKKSICPPEGCTISGGIRRRRHKGRKTRKVRKSRKNKKSNRKSKRKI